MGQGIISVSKALFEKHEGIVNEHEPLKQPETLAEWHALLMLPEEYHLLEVKGDVIYPEWHITVESEAIPVAEGKLPDVSLTYRSEYNQDDGTRKNYLERIELYPYTSERNVIWQRSEQGEKHE